MVQYATAAELASYLQQDVDTSTATLLLQLASAEFDNEADTTFTPTTVTHSEVGNGSRVLIPPFKPIISINAVRINNVTVTDYTVVTSRIWYAKLYRNNGFGYWLNLQDWIGFPPQNVEVDLTYGYATPPDDVKASVLETAAQAYHQPTGAVIAEAIDDYKVSYAAHIGGVQLTSYAQKIAASYVGSGYYA